MKTMTVNEIYPLAVPDHVADWARTDWPDGGWERERIDHMVSTLRPGDLLFDIGAEHGWMSGLFARYAVGGENVVLVEPKRQFWRNIQRVWLNNDLKAPRGTVVAFVDDHLVSPDFCVVDKDWPHCVLGREVERGLPYPHLLAQKDLPSDEQIPSVTIDFLAAAFGRPKAITMDIEGAELRALRGAAGTLTGPNKPLMWISVHPEMMDREFGDDMVSLFNLMESYGYGRELLSIDHEQHWFFDPR